MRLLMFTQSVDLDNPQFSFVHRWIDEFATHFEHIHVICLKEGRHLLPSNVQVHSLGKESGQSRIKYVRRVFEYAWKLRTEYDLVFVHQNQEYILIAGWLWRFLGKKIYLWRNHHVGDKQTDKAARYCEKIFCTSKYSYTMKFPQTTLMPVGVDTEVFKPMETIPRKESVLSLGRIAPSKRIEIIIDAILLLAQNGIQLKAFIYGDPLPEDEPYMQMLLKKVRDARLEHLIFFYPGVRNAETPRIYSGHETFVNCSESGMYDKTIFEALSCGSLAIASSGDYKEVADPQLYFDGSAADLEARLEDILRFTTAEKDRMRTNGFKLAEMNSLHALSQRLSEELK